MLVPSSRRALSLTVLAAVGLHVGVGLWLLAPGARAGSVGGVGEGSPAPITLVSIQRTASEVEVIPRPAAEQAQQQAAPPKERRPLIPATAAASTPASSAQATQGGAASTGGSEPFVAASLSGEPVVPLSDDDAAVAGSLSLRLTIDETGRVIDSQVVSRDGLTDGAVAVFVRSFSGYEYLPARRGGRPVRSDVTMVVGVQEGEPKKRP